jgi:hypothetical protein
VHEIHVKELHGNSKPLIQKSAGMHSVAQEIFNALVLNTKYEIVTSARVWVMSENGLFLLYNLAEWNVVSLDTDRYIWKTKQFVLFDHLLTTWRS